MQMNSVPRPEPNYCPPPLQDAGWGVGSGGAAGGERRAGGGGCAARSARAPVAAARRPARAGRRRRRRLVGRALPAGAGRGRAARLPPPPALPAPRAARRLRGGAVRGGAAGPRGCARAALRRAEGAAALRPFGQPLSAPQPYGPLAAAHRRTSTLLRGETVSTAHICQPAAGAGEALASTAPSSAQGLPHSGKAFDVQCSTVILVLNEPGIFVLLCRDGHMKCTRGKYATKSVSVIFQPS